MKPTTTKEAVQTCGLIGLWALAGIYALVNHQLTVEYNERVTMRQHYEQQLAAKATLLPPPAFTTKTTKQS